MSLFSTHISLALGSPRKKQPRPIVSEPILRWVGGEGIEQVDPFQVCQRKAGWPAESSPQGRQPWGQLGLELFLWPTGRI